MKERHITQKAPFVMEMEPGTYHYCRCGASKNQPFCDGAHTGSDKTPLTVQFTEKKTAAWCGCRHTESEPYCNGAHKNL